MKVVLFSRDCGATAGHNTQAMLLRKEEPLPGTEGNLFIVDSGSATVAWKGNKRIAVEFDGSVREFKKKTSLYELAIEYTVKPANASR
jgi:hypothetical protein